MITVDGSAGEGGGQILRSSLALSATLGVPVRIENIRAGRPRPGLGSQHLAAARAVAEVCGGDLEGAARGSPELAFRPGRARPGAYSFKVGTAGSTTLIFQTLLPVLAASGGRSAISISGGTHNPMAPPADFIRECFLPAVGRLGLVASCDLVRHGFYPRGGGEIRACVEPWGPPGGPLDLAEETDWGDPEATILLAGLPGHVADRERRQVAKDLGMDREAVDVDHLPGEVGPGNVVMIRVRSAGRTSLFTSFGERGKKAEMVGLEAAGAARSFAVSRAPVDPRLADQLLLPMALSSGGSFVTNAVTLHTRTHAEVVRMFLGVDVSIARTPSGLWRITVPGTNRCPGAGGSASH